MEKKPKLVDFDECRSSVLFSTTANTVTCTKVFYKDKAFVAEDFVTLDLRMMTLQTALSVAAEYVRNVVLVDYEEGK